MKTFKRLLAAGIMAPALMATAAIAAAPESTDPIKIVQNNWTSQLVLSIVVGEVLKSMGYNVEYKSSDTQLQYQALANGDMDFQVEVWEGSQRDSFEKALAGGAVDLGAHDAITREEWWYPKYVNATFARDCLTGRHSTPARPSSRPLRPATRAASLGRRPTGASTIPSVSRL